MLSACSSGSTGQVQTAASVFERAQAASENLTSVTTRLSFDDFVKDSEKEEPFSNKMQIDSVAQFHPLVNHQEVIIQPRIEEPWKMDLYQLDDTLVVKDDHHPEWKTTSVSQFGNMFGGLVANASPAMDLSIFEPFVEEMELVPVHYGYALNLSLSAEQYKQFVKLLYEQMNNAETPFDEKMLGYPIVEKMDIELIINSKTFYVTSAKVTMDVTNYFGRETLRTRQKLSANYSYFDDTGTVQVPADVQQLTK